MKSYYIVLNNKQTNNNNRRRALVERPKTDTHPHLQQILELPVNLACLQTVKENIHMQRGKIAVRETNMY